LDKPKAYLTCLNRYREALWVAHLDECIKSFTEAALSMPNLESLIVYLKGISEEALKWLLGLGPLGSIKYIHPDQAYLIYSARRALPKPQQAPDEEALIAPLYELPIGVFSYAQAKEIFNSVKTPKLNPRGYPTLVSNKSCLESRRSDGGRDFISSLLKPLFPDTGMELPEGLDYPGCTYNPLYEELMVINQAKFRQYAHLASIAFTLLDFTRRYRPPLLAALFIPERGHKFRVPHIPEWHNVTISEVIGYYGFLTVGRLCPNTYRQKKYELPDDVGRLYYSGDFKSATDYLPHHVAIAAWEVILSRSGLPGPTVELFVQAIKYLIGPHILLRGHSRTAYASRYVRKLILPLPVVRDLKPAFAVKTRDYIVPLEVVDDPFDDVPPPPPEEDIPPPPPILAEGYPLPVSQGEIDELDFLSDGGSSPIPIDAPALYLNPLIDYPVGAEYIPSNFEIESGIQMIPPPRDALGEITLRYHERLSALGVAKGYLHIVRSLFNTFPADKIVRGYEQLETKSINLVELFDLLSERPTDPRLTTRGVHMSYGISFPVLTFVNYCCHISVGIDHDHFIVTGDDNTSSVTLEQYHDLLATQKMMGFVENTPKSHLSADGHLHAEVVYHREGPFLKKIETFHMKMLYPQKDEHHYLTLPRALAIASTTTKVRGIVARAYSLIFHRYRLKYERLMKDINIFHYPPGNPIFPFELFKDQRPVPKHRFPEMVISGATPRVNLQALVAAITVHVKERVSWTVPGLDDPESYARPLMTSAEELAGVLASYVIPSQVTTPFPTPPYRIRTPIDVLKSYREAEVISDMEPTIVVSSILGLLQGKRYIPDNSRFSEVDYLPPFSVIEGAFGWSVLAIVRRRCPNTQTIIFVVPQRKRAILDVAFRSRGQIIVLWESLSTMSNMDSIRATLKWASENGPVTFFKRRYTGPIFHARVDYSLEERH
jgi:hypothetical protein